MSKSEISFSLFPHGYAQVRTWLMPFLLLAKLLEIPVSKRADFVQTSLEQNHYFMRLLYQCITHFVFCVILLVKDASYDIGQIHDLLKHILVLWHTCSELVQQIVSNRSIRNSREHTSHIHSIQRNTVGATHWGSSISLQ